MVKSGEVWVCIIRVIGDLLWQWCLYLVVRLVVRLVVKQILTEPRL